MKQKQNYGTLKNMMQILSKIISWTVFVLLALIVCFLVYYFISLQVYTKKGEKFEPILSLYTIVSPSMVPTINVYDVIVNKKVTHPEDIKEGDIITFISTSNISKGMTITHRVVKIEENNGVYEFTTRGDNNPVTDSGKVKIENVLGKVILKIPQLGRVQYFLATKGGWLIAVILPAALIIINDIKKILKLSKAKNKVEKVTEVKEDPKKKEKELERKENLKRKLESTAKSEKTIDLHPKKTIVKVKINEDLKIPNTKVQIPEIPKVKNQKLKNQKLKNQKSKSQKSKNQKAKKANKNKKG